MYVAAEMADKYLDTLDLSTKTRHLYRSGLNTFLRWMRENNYHTIGTAIKYYDVMLRRDGRYSEATLKAYTSLARRFATWLADEKRVDAFDMSQAQSEPGHRKNPPTKLDAGDLKYVCDIAKRGGEAGLRGRAMLLLAMTCSLTPAQISQIGPMDAFLGEEGARVRVEASDGARISVELTHSARDAIVEYLAERGDVDPRLPLVAVTTSKGNRKAMSASDVRKCLAKVLDYLAYDYCDVFNGDCERLVASYIGHLGESARQELAAHAARLYFSANGLG